MRGLWTALSYSCCHPNFYRDVQTTFQNSMALLGKVNGTYHLGLSRWEFAEFQEFSHRIVEHPDALLEVEKAFGLAGATDRDTAAVIGLLCIDNQFAIDLAGSGSAPLAEDYVFQETGIDLAGKILSVYGPMQTQAGRDAVRNFEGHLWEVGGNAQDELIGKDLACSPSVSVDADYVHSESRLVANQILSCLQRGAAVASGQPVVGQPVTAAFDAEVTALLQELRQLGDYYRFEPSLLASFPPATGAAPVTITSQPAAIPDKGWEPATLQAFGLE